MNGYYNEFERISDIVMVLDIVNNYPNGLLKMNTQLGKRNKNGYREPFATGFIVKSGNYKYNTNKISIKRDFTYYLSLEIIKDPNFFVKIEMYNIILFRQKLNEAFSNWYSSDNIWMMTKEGPKVNIGKVSPIEIVGFNPENKTIRFDPIVINRNGLADRGMRISVNSSPNYIDLDMDRLMGFIYQINGFDMYNAAINQINSLTIYQHPHFVQELVQMSGSDSDKDYIEMKEKENESIKAVNGRRPKSFFDKNNDINSLE